MAGKSLAKKDIFGARLALQQNNYEIAFFYNFPFIAVTHMSV